MSPWLLEPHVQQPEGLRNGAFQFAVSSLPGAGVMVFGSTDVDLPFDLGFNPGPAVEMPLGSGQFQFIDLQATHHPGRFHRVGLP